MEKQDKKQLIQAYKDRKIVGGVCGVKNAKNGKYLLEATNDINGSRNRLEFCKKTGSPLQMRIQKDWNEFGSDAFAFEVLEELEKKPEQTDKEFRDDLNTLLELWQEKLGPEQLY